MTNDEAKKCYYQMVKNCADQITQIWRDTQGMQTFNIFYKSGELRGFDQHENPDPTTWKLATTEKLRPSTPYSYLFTWIEERCRRAPCLPS